MGPLQGNAGVVQEARCYLSVTQKEVLLKEALCTLGVGFKWPKILPERKVNRPKIPTLRITPSQEAKSPHCVPQKAGALRHLRVGQRAAGLRTSRGEGAELVPASMGAVSG